MNNDALGEALKDYWFSEIRNQQIKITSDIIDDDYMPVDVFFRTFEEMPQLEQQALNLARGKVLDIGAGAGCHLNFFKDLGVSAIGLDNSSGACEVMSNRDFSNIHDDIFTYQTNTRFDTIYLLMNGIGMCGTLQKLPEFLNKLTSLLTPDGQLIFDSSDVRYLYEDNDGSMLVNLNQQYYGDFWFTMHYKHIKSAPFQWSYIDFESVDSVAKQLGWKTTLLAEGEHYDYMAKLHFN